MVKKAKWLVQGLFLAFFVALNFMGNLQGWMIIFLAGIIGALLLGRVYCGWLCPINTSLDIINQIYKKLGIKRRDTPNWAKHRAVRYGMVILFVATMVFILVTGNKLPVLLVLTILGIVLSLFFIPDFWHRYLCPYGTVLNLPSFLARYHFKVKNDSCSKCGLCKKACPAQAVAIPDKGAYPIIDKGLCLQCRACVQACPKDAIKYFNN